MTEVPYGFQEDGHRFLLTSPTEMPAASTFLWNRRAVVHHEQLTEHINAYNPASQAAMTQLGHGDTQLGGSIINGMITQQGYQIAFNEVFHALGWVFVGLMLVIWLARPPFTAKAGAAPGGH